MLSAVALPFMLIQHTSLFILLGIPLFFGCITAAWYLWLRKLPANVALLVGGIATSAIALILFVWESLIRDTIAFNLILIAEASVFIFMGLLALIITSCRNPNISAGAATTLSICVFAYCVWIWGWGEIPFGYGP